jgi:hypothetical protein
METQLAANARVEDASERNDRSGMELRLVRNLAGVTRDLTSLWCDNVCFPWDIHMSIPHSGQSLKTRRYLNGLAATYQIYSAIRIHV